MNLGTRTRCVAALTAGLPTIVSLWVGCGCASQPSFPAPIEVRAETNETVLAFDTDRDQRADFWQYQRPGGRKHALAYAAERSEQPGERIDLDAIDPAECPHFVIVLDGVPFELVDQLYREGHFRFFHPPAKVICGFPSMTDLALNEFFHTGRCLAYEALYFDRRANRLTDGTAVYLSARNSRWLEQMDYRCSFWWDAQAYLNPQALFDHEINGIIRTFRSIEDGERYAYTVGTAGLGTRGGREAILKYLRTVDRLCEQIVFERRGRVKITLTADHGHNLVENRRISFRKALEGGGYRQAKSLREPRDVVPISYGLVTYTAFYTNDPAGVANCLVGHEDVEFACYPADDAVIVCDRTGHARITKGETGFVYDTREADPLKLNPITEQLRRDGRLAADGGIDDESLFSATVDHYYPDPLARIWAAFHESVENPPDLIANLRDGACYGSRFFHAMIGNVASTHGSLNRANSTTFVLTTLGELPPALRPHDLLPALEILRSEPQPRSRRVGRDPALVFHRVEGGSRPTLQKCQRVRIAPWLAFRQRDACSSGSAR
ncbi:MAG TPA: hypothetical protein VM487_18100 [Phycisphaerae bacterium]|nr:hypothetical protein [Phycisphaerae bacterium]